MKTDLEELNNDDTHIQNRQINYTIIRIMWDAINKGLGPLRVLGYENDINSMTGMFETSKCKWDSIVNGEVRNIGLKTLPKHLEKKTGIPKDVFTGEERIHLDDEMDAIVEQIVLSDKQDSKRSMARHKLFSYLKNFEPDYDQNKTLFLAAFFINKKQPFALSVKNSDNILKFAELLNSLKIKQLNNVDLNTLRHYRIALLKQYKLVDAIITCKKNC